MVIERAIERLTQLFFKTKSYIGIIEIDSIVEESVTIESEITEYPVEAGANVNDHVIIKPAEFLMKGVVSDSSNYYIYDTSTIKDRFVGDVSKSKVVWEQLLKLQAERQPFVLIQNLKSYSNVLITSLSTSQDKDTSRALFFTAALKEVILSSVEQITAENFNDTNIADKMIPAVDGGLKQTS